MKILIATTFYYPIIRGGAEISTQIMAEGLVRKGHDVHIITSGLKNSEEFINGVKIFRKKFPDSDLCLGSTNKGKLHKIKELYNEFFYSPKYMKIYDNILESDNYDAAHASGNLYCLGRYNFWRSCMNHKVSISQALRDPKLCHLDFANGLFDRLLCIISANGISKLDSIVAPSEFMLKFYKDRGIVNSNCNVIYNAVDCERLCEIDFYNKRQQILYVGRITKEKGILTLVKAMDGVNAGIELLIIGEGDALNGYTLPKSVKMLGYMERNEVYKIMSRSKAVVLPSEWPEAFGRTIIESYYSGTIPIGSDSGAIPEILDGKYIFKSRNCKELSNLINKVVSYEENEYKSEMQLLSNGFKRFLMPEYIDNFEEYFVKNTGESKVLH